MQEDYEFPAAIKEIRTEAIKTKLMNEVSSLWGAIHIMGPSEEKLRHRCQGHLINLPRKNETTCNRPCLGASFPRPCWSLAVRPRASLYLRMHRNVAKNQCGGCSTREKVNNSGEAKTSGDTKDLDIPLERRFLRDDCAGRCSGRLFYNAVSTGALIL